MYNIANKFSYADTEIERRYLIQKIYPYLKSYALQRNFELHITDLAYPPNQGLFDDHSQCSLPFQVLEDAMNHKDKFIFVVSDENYFFFCKQWATIFFVCIRLIN